jgi:hypothetical protein
MNDNSTDSKIEQVSPGGLRRTCHWLGDKDRHALSIICKELGLSSGSLAIRYSLRFVCEKLERDRLGIAEG